ncbi:hypothetical protein [Actinocorallia aurantiaca]|uniref:Uncharacterized protein n=1 Tax=Actinocorallia aurantiaca TaxID=46204 RepID=A0ABN3UJB3_9ACTN
MLGIGAEQLLQSPRHAQGSRARQVVQSVHAGHSPDMFDGGAQALWRLPLDKVHDVRGHLPPILTEDPRQLF